METKTLAVRARFDQCMFGGRARKRTILSGTLSGMSELDKVWCDGSHSHAPTAGTDAQGRFHTTCLAAYPGGLCKKMAELILRTVRLKRADPAGHQGRKARIGAWSLSAQEGSRGMVILNETAQQGQLTTLGGENDAVYLHVDDGVVMSENKHASGRWAADVWVDQFADGLEELGFEVKDRQYNGECDKVLGYEPVNSPPRLRLPREKAALIQASLEALVANTWVEVELLAGVLGVWVWGALLRRELLSIPAQIFDFVRKHEKRLARWWPQARAEARMMAQAVPLMYADLSLAVAPTVFATDAQGAGEQHGCDGGGYGVVAADVGVGVAFEMVRRGVQPGLAVVRLNADLTSCRQPVEEVTRRLPFTRIPAEVLEGLPWQAVEAGRWRFKDHITLGEARAATRPLALISAFVGGRRHRLVSLQDNAAVSGAFTKGRSSAVALNYLLRKRSAFALASELTLVLPWVQTDHMPADWLSRLSEADASALLGW